MGTYDPFKKKMCMFLDNMNEKNSSIERQANNVECKRYYNPNAIPLVIIYEQQNLRKKPKRLLFEMNEENCKGFDNKLEINKYICIRNRIWHGQ